MPILRKVEAYPTPGGGFETDPVRAVAWHMARMGRDVNGNSLSFTDALEYVKQRDKVRELFDELDSILGMEKKRDR